MVVNYDSIYRKYAGDLIEFLNKWFDLEDLEILFFKLGFDIDELGERGGKERKVIKIIEHCRKNLKLVELLDQIYDERTEQFRNSKLPDFARELITNPGSDGTQLEAYLYQQENNELKGSQSDIYSRYEVSISNLMGHFSKKNPRYAEVLVYKSRLIENISQSRQYGDTDSRKAERMEIVHFLNQLSLSEIGVAFSELDSFQ